MRGWLRSGLRKCLGLWLILNALTPTFGADGPMAWPDFISQLVPGRADTSVTATLPTDSTVRQPPAGTPPERLRWSGTWQGWACVARACDVRLAIESVDAAGATVAYGAASEQLAPVSLRAQGKFVEDELRVALENGFQLVMRLRADGDMELLLTRATQWVMAGVLTRRPLPPPLRPTIERIATPWREDGKSQSLALLVFRPEGDGPFPTLVVNHGSTGQGIQPDLFRISWTSSEIARFFLDRGWLVLFPQRRGRGGSDGLYDEGFRDDRSAGYSCDPSRALAGYDRASADLAVIMDAVQARADVDRKKILISGVSRGGILAVGQAGEHPDQFVGVINFVGGWVGAACPRADDINPVLMKRGAGFGHPMLWLYGDHDSFYPLSETRKSFEAFIDAGGQGELITFELPPGADGHGLHRAPELWSPAVERYLASIGLDEAATRSQSARPASRRAPTGPAGAAGRSP